MGSQPHRTPPLLAQGIVLFLIDGEKWTLDLREGKVRAGRGEALCSSRRGLAWQPGKAGQAAFCLLKRPCFASLAPLPTLCILPCLVTAGQPV